MTINEVLLNDLLIQAEKCLQELKYSKQTIKTYRLIWQHFSDYAQNECQHQYSKGLASGFLDQYYGISDLGNPKKSLIVPR
jgi:hypothetical protein